MKRLFTAVLIGVMGLVSPAQAQTEKVLGEHYITGEGLLKQRSINFRDIFTITAWIVLLAACSYIFVNGTAKVTGGQMREIWLLMTLPGTK